MLPDRSNTRINNANYVNFCYLIFNIEITCFDYRTEWQYLVDRFTVNNRYLGRMVNYVTSHFTTNIRLEEVIYLILLNRLTMVFFMMLLYT